MPISKDIKTPGIYTDVNINTQRNGLLSNTQKVLFITADSAKINSSAPVDIYDTASADAKFGTDSVAGRMMKAAIKTFRTVDVQCLGKPQLTISCDGATSFTELAGDSDGVILNQIKAIELDGITYTNGSPPPQNQIRVTQNKRKKYDKNGVDFQWQYYITISNIDTVEHRVKLIGYDSKSADSENLAVNPTLSFDESGNPSFCLSVAVAQDHCYNFSQSEISNLKSSASSFFMNNASNAHGIVNFDPAYFSISANGNNVELTQGDGGTTWGTTTDLNINVSDADGYLQFTNVNGSAVIVQICSKAVIPADISPIYSAALSSIPTELLFHRDDEGYESCLFILAIAT